jgi:thiamine monophosphate synthase
MAEIVTADIDRIAINPYRRLHAFPYIDSKLEALERSIRDVGLWPSVIARALGDQKLWQYELAFGHHRIEAARRLKIKAVQLIVEKLTDKQMLQYMGRENLEDYNASFLIQLESWEAAIKSGLTSRIPGKLPQPIDIATLLGWTRLHAGQTLMLNDTAEACRAAYALIEGGYNSREEFANLTVSAVQRIAVTTVKRHEQLDEMGAAGERPKREIETAKRQYGRAAADTAKQVREGTVYHRDIRSNVDFKAALRAKDRPSPLFAVFANTVADNLKRTINSDADAEKLATIERVLSQISMLEDWEALRRLDVELVNLGERASGWRKRLTPSREKVVQFRALEKKGA